MFIAGEGKLKKKIIKKPPVTPVEDIIPAIDGGEDEPRPIDVGGIFEKVFNPPDEKPEE